MHRCSDCATDNPEGEGFCCGCGRPLGGPPICAVCGRENLPGSRFCNSCGSALTAAAAAPAGPEPALPAAQSAEAEADVATAGEAEQPRLGDDQAWHEVVRLMNALADEAVLAQSAPSPGDGKQPPPDDAARSVLVEPERCPSQIAMAASVEGSGPGPSLRLFPPPPPAMDVEELASVFAKVSSTPPLAVRVSKRRSPWQQSAR